ncbi:ribonuclease H-like domain-containing protein [Tanacetum coccineum]
MLAIPDEHLLKFHACKDAKSLWEVIKNRFRGNKESKKMQKTILKQNYENFAASSQEGLDKTYDRFQKLISQLEIHGGVISQEDANLKLLRILTSKAFNSQQNDKEIVGFDKTKVECYKYHRRGHFTRECREPRNQGNRNRDAPRRNALVDTSTTNALVVQDGIASSSSSSSDSEVNTCSKDCLKSYETLQKQYDQQRNALNKSNLEIIVLNNKGRVTGQREIRPVWNNAQRVNHQNKLTHPHPKRNFIPTVVATKSGQVTVNAAKQNSLRATISISTTRTVNTATPKPKVNDALPITYSYFKAHSPIIKTIDGGCVHLEEVPYGGEGGKITEKKIRLGKFDRKADEGFLVGYFTNSKAFRVFNTRTRKVEENLHITFLENKPNVVGSGLDWLFDIDLLTNSMNYEPITIGNQTNRNAGIKDNVDKEGYATSTNRVSTVSPSVSAAGQSFDNADDLPTDPLMPNLEDTTD